MPACRSSLSENAAFDLGPTRRILVKKDELKETGRSRRQARDNAGKQIQVEAAVMPSASS